MHLWADIACKCFFCCSQRCLEGSVMGIDKLIKYRKWNHKKSKATYIKITASALLLCLLAVGAAAFVTEGEKQPVFYLSCSEYVLVIIIIIHLIGRIFCSFLSQCFYLTCQSMRGIITMTIIMLLIKRSTNKRPILSVVKTYHQEKFYGCYLEWLGSRLF